MSNLNHWKQRIQEKRKKTPFSEYLKEIGSWYPLVLSKDGNKLSRYPITDRVWSLSDTHEYEEMREWFIESGLAYDESISFLDNYKKLFLQIPHPRMLARNSENCDYVDDVINSKDSYLSFMIITDCSNNLYSLIVKENCHDIVNSINVLNNCSHVFMSNAVMNSYNIFYSSNIINSSDVWFSSNLMACTIFAGSYTADDMYGVMICGINTSDIYCSYAVVDNCSNVFYSYALETCSYCIWCIGLKNKSYCILNKQYTKDQWEVLANEIFSSMESDNTLWDFFSPELNPFYFNDTFAGLLWNYDKQEIEKHWYLWREDSIKVDVNESWDIIPTNDLDDFESLENNTWSMDKEILKKVIQDDAWNYYRIVKPEYDFLMKHWLPLPRKHWFDRIKNNFWITK